LVSPWLKPDQKQPYSTINARDDRIQTALHFQQRTAPFAFGSGAAVYTDSLLLRSHQSCVRGLIAVGRRLCFWFHQEPSAPKAKSLTCSI
jgi:hypothetical protein